jgi:hypothetical protein
MIMEAEMERTIKGTKTNLVIVRHPQVGDEERGKKACAQINRVIAGKPGPVLFLHDASAMDRATTAYISAFRKLDKCLMNREVEFVCIAPASGPRAMVYIMSMLSSKKWAIFRDKADAMIYLASKGVDLKDVIVSPQETVSIKLMAA